MRTADRHTTGDAAPHAGAHASYAACVSFATTFSGTSRTPSSAALTPEAPA